MPRARDATFDIAGLAVRVRGLPERLASRLRSEWKAFEASSREAWFLDVEARVGPEIEDSSPFGAKAMTARFDGGTARYAMPEGSAEVPLEGPIQVEVGSTSGPKQLFALVNLLCAAFAWRLPSRSGAVLHAAGIVLDDHAFVLVGPEGSGKTTWALLAREAGAGVLSDDLVVVIRGASGRFDAISTPFRSAQHGTLGPGRWPVAAWLLPDHGAPARLSPVAPLRVRARITANLPFVAEASGGERRVEEVVEELVAGVGSWGLTFSLDASFVGVLRGVIGRDGTDTSE